LIAVVDDEYEDSRTRKDAYGLSHARWMLCVDAGTVPAMSHSIERSKAERYP
jgi:hypothetical protein